MLAWTLQAPGMFAKREVAEPTVEDLVDGQVLLRVRVGGICGSDLPYFAGAVHSVMVDDAPGAAGIAGYPMHELVAEVVASRDPGLGVGELVVGWASASNAMASYVVNAGRDV